MENNWMINAIRAVDADPAHDLRQYINFDGGLPGHLNECSHPLQMPTSADHASRKALGSRSNGNDFLRRHCEDLAEDFIIYGVIGRGTFGSIFAARTKHEVDGRIRHYAIKVMLYTGEGETTQIGFFDRSPEGTGYPAHKEAATLNCLRGNDRVSQIHSAYLHEGVAYIVMNQFGVDYSPEMDTLPSLKDMQDPKYPGFNGTELTDNEYKETRLKEPQVRKVVSHLLEALMFLNDRRMTHQDMSHRNYLVDEELNVQLIDFDVEFSARAPDALRPCPAGFVRATEHMATPELCALLLRLGAAADLQRQVDYRTRDARDEPLWRLGVIMFELLHGYSPWDSPDMDDPPLYFDHLGVGEEYLAECRAHRDDRRRRMQHDPVQISDTISLSQDCVDVLNAMLANNVKDRPTIEQLVAFPWFQGSYLDGGDDFLRPGRADGDRS